MVSAGLGLRTVVLEAAAEPAWKPGEVLPPECNPILKELGLWGSLAARPDLAISSAGVRSRWGGEDIFFRDGFCEPLGAGWIIDRRAFEAFLSERAVAAGARWLWGARVHSTERQDGGWRIGTGRGEPFLLARLVIDATGRPAKIARKLGAERIRYQPQIVTVARWPSTQSPSAWLDIESVPDGWWYGVSDPSGAQIIAWFGDHAEAGPSSDTMREAFAATHFLKSVITLPRTTEPMQKAVVNAESTALGRCAGDGWLAVGDAAAAFDPIASQGLSNALASGNAAAHAAHDWLRGKFAAIETYAAEMAAAYAFYLDGVQQHYRSERRWPDRPFWKIRHADASQYQGHMARPMDPAREGPPVRCELPQHG
jgi:flavin-dependent dehydrogenase